MVPQEPGILSRPGAREAGAGVAAGAPWVLEAAGDRGAGAGQFKIKYKFQFKFKNPG